MTPQCPYCAHELGPYPERTCPSCGQDISAFLPPAYLAQSEDPRFQIARFHSTLMAMTPRTWAITAIVILNVLVFLAMVMAGGNIMNPGGQMILDWGANYGPRTLNGQSWRLLTCMFLHFGIIHIGFNMFVLWQIGHLVERLVGNIGLLLLYLASGIAASIASLAWNPMAVSAGASGAVFGVCGALLGFIIVRHDTIPSKVIRSLRSSLVTFVVYNVAFGMLIPAIDMAAHLGGLGYGVLCGLVLSQPVTLGSTTKRWQRNVFLLVGSAVVLPAAFLLLPPAPRDTTAIENQIRDLDQQAIASFNRLAAKMQDQSINNEQFVAMLREQVAPRWQTALELSRTAIEDTDAQPGSLLMACHAYLTKRVATTAALANAIHAGDQQQVSRQTDAWQRLNQRRAQIFSPNNH